MTFIRPKKNICVFQVSRPYLGFWPDPKHFIVLKKKYIYIIKIKKLHYGHKTYGSILSLRDRFFFGILYDITVMKLKNFLDTA